METDQEPVGMLDLLASKCNELTGLLFGCDPSKEEEILFKYIEEVDNQFKCITDLKEDFDWFNVIEPLTFSSCLKGKIIVLDFFTYCCINCMHILPDLKKIEQIYSVEDGLIIIGVHSPKFDNEKDSSNILSAIQRYDITHPVINDPNSILWDELNIICWPTLLVLGPNANPLFVLMGEGHYDTLKKYVSSSIKYYKNKNMIKEHSLPLNPATELIVDNNLKFPGKIVCSKKKFDEDCAELYAISDSGKNRVLILNSSGEVLQKIGGKLPGFQNGDFKTCRFNNPQGLDFLNSDILFVADTNNHAIRKINLKLKTVETVAGTGKQGEDRTGGKVGTSQELASPWDLCIYKTRDMDMSFHMDESQIPEKSVIIIAMAGIHQIWALFLDDVIWWKYKKYVAGTCIAIAGNGREANKNNSYPLNACLAQPSGITIAKERKELFFADSESSCIRKISLVDGHVSAVAGGDPNPDNLMAFGDHDGKSLLAKFQHPLGVAHSYKDDFVYITDTYNHKLKRINPKTNSAETVKILDKTNNLYQFNEPGGLCFNPSCDILYVADTNNHAIEIIDMHTMKRKTMDIIFDLNEKLKQNLGKYLEFPKLKIQPTGGKIKLSILLKFIDDTHLTDDAPQKWNIYLPCDNWYINQLNGIYKDNEPIELDITVPPFKMLNDLDANNNDIILSFKLNCCLKTICFPKIFAIKFPVVYNENGLDCIIEEATIRINQKDVSL